MPGDRPVYRLTGTGIRGACHEDTTAITCDRMNVSANIRTADASATGRSGPGGRSLRQEARHERGMALSPGQFGMYRSLVMPGAAPHEHSAALRRPGRGPAGRL